MSNTVLWIMGFAALLLGGVTACTTSGPASTTGAVETVVVATGSQSGAPQSQRQTAQQLKALPPLPTSASASAVRSDAQLDVGILIFGSQDGSDPAGLKEQGVYPLVRKAETRYLPFLLRQTLEATSQWGAVRVMPDAHASTELVISGEIQVSNGEQLQIKILAKDSSQRLWLNKVYRQNVNAAAYEDSRVDPFQPLFDRLALDLKAVHSQLTASELQAIHQLAVLRYGQQLAPNAFNTYLQTNDQGQYVLKRLPARNDPMLKRVTRLRDYEYFFIDTVDEQYSALFVEMKPTYQRWRQYSRELMVYMRDYKARQVGKSSGFRRGSLASMNEVYGDYEWYRTQQMNLNELAAGFNNEVLPTVLNLDDNVIQLDGNLQDQYSQWQNILKEIFQLEQGEI
ncbi:hypothetical protein G8770_02945 [Aestuariicella hydrocarbonica]|uniref:Lipoprotein n=1 Tax=Pseudomaricurvus hydrocarbonicus TaxID=1470433 RepID=A0A9E5JYK5_9GAMM|nr:hypothetical protein [Aestuariicella hydrocarbonica]NHO64502.1 hypothetical protein [Aestuariicella hydrocarbonica]